MRQTTIFVENQTMKKTLLSLLVCMAPFCVLAQLPSYLPTDGLVGWWPFNGNANDESGNGNDGYNYLFNGSTFYLNTSPSNSYGVDRNGNSESALSTNVYASNVMLPINNFLFQSDFTISIWAKNDSLIAQYPTILESGNNHLTMQYGNTGGPISFGAYLTEVGISPFGGVGALAPPLEWLQITLVNENYQNKLYFNGILVDSTNDFNTQQAQTDWMYLRVGNGMQLPQEAFFGLVDDIAIYNRALTPEEITALYTATPTNGGGGNNTASANVPQGISYQAVARNPQGLPLSNTALQVKFTLLSDSLTGTAEYAELHSLTTNDLGLFTTAFGTGTPLSGTFANINWAGGNKFVKIEADQGSGFIEMGTQQMLSVPYSMRSHTAAKAGTIENSGLPVYANNAAALAGGLQAGQMYRTAAGDLKIVY